MDLCRNTKSDPGGPILLLVSDDMEDISQGQVHGRHQFAFHCVFRPLIRMFIAVFTPGASDASISE